MGLSGAGVCRGRGTGCQDLQAAVDGIKKRWQMSAYSRRRNHGMDMGTGNAHSRRRPSRRDGVMRCSRRPRKLDPARCEC